MTHLIGDTAIRHTKSNGWFDYNDLTTHTTPIAYTTGTIAITNDGLGAFSQNTFKPRGVTNLWNVATNKFNFSECEIGNEIVLRVDLLVTTLTPNQEVNLNLTFDIGGSPYSLNVCDVQFKTAKQYNIVRYARFYIGNEGTKNNPTELTFTSDGGATIIVNGFYVSLTKII